MRVGYLYGTNTYPPRSGGSIHVYNLVEHLSQLGHEIHALGEETNPRCVVHPGSDVAGFLEAIDLLYVRIDGWFLLQSRLKLSCLDSVADDVPVVWEINAPAGEALADQEFPRRGGGWRPPITWVREVRRNRRLRSLVVAEEETRRAYAAGVAAAVAVSRPLADYAREDLGIARTVVVPNGSDPVRFHPDKARGGTDLAGRTGLDVVYAGNSKWPWQGVDLVLDTARLAARDGLPMRFLVLDNSPDGIGTDVDANVEVLSRVDYDEAPVHLASADVALCLYHDFEWLRHGFHLSPLKLFDYMASGTPVVGSRLGQIAEIIEPRVDGWLVGEGSAAVYDALGKALEQRDRLADMGAAARRKIVEGHTWADVARATSELFESVV